MGISIVFRIINLLSMGVRTFRQCGAFAPFWLEKLREIEEILGFFRFCPLPHVSRIGLPPWENPVHAHDAICNSIQHCVSNCTRKTSQT